MANWLHDPKYQDLNTSENGAVAKSMLSILCLKQAKDFWEEDYVAGHSNKDDIYHIFPRAGLRDKSWKKKGFGIQSKRNNGSRIQGWL